MNAAGANLKVSHGRAPADANVGLLQRVSGGFGGPGGALRIPEAGRAAHDPCAHLGLLSSVPVPVPGFRGGFPADLGRKANENASKSGPKARAI